ncbi:YhgE/Pip family protein [Streptococcus hongkongensis]|nr:hypothetical protein NC01_09140 [Streptococcus uberis]
MFKETKTLLKSPNLWVTIIGIALVPALYNIVFLSSMWNPYSHFNKFPVAVVNKDKSATLQDKTFNAGEKLVDNMSKNKELDYHFVSEKQAEKGLQSGKYYLVVTFPEDLSKNAATVLTDHPKKAEIKYETSKGHNFISSKLSQSMMIRLESKVSKTITDTYNKELFSKVKQLQNGMGQAANGSKRLADGSKQTASGSQEFSDNLLKLSSAGQAFSAGANKLNSGLGLYTNGVSQLDSGITGLSSGLNLYTSGVSKLGSGLGTLSSGLYLYTGGVATLNEKMGLFSSGVTEYTNGVNALSAGASQLDSKSAALVDGANKLKSGASGMQALVDGANKLSAGLAQMQSQTTTSPTQAQQIQAVAASLNNLQTKITEINTEVSQLPEGAVPSVNVASIQTALSNIAAQVANFSTTAPSSSSNALASVQATSAYAAMTPAQQAEITSAISNSTTTTTSSNTAIAQAISENVATIQTALASLQAGLGQTGPTGSIAQLKTSVATLKAGSDQAIPVATGTIAKLSTGLASVNSALSQELVPGSQQLVGGVQVLQNQLSTNGTALADGISKYTTGVSQLNSGASRLASNSSMLAGSANALSSGTSQLNGKSAQLNAGAAQLADGASQLNSKTADVTTGVSKLQEGADTLNGKSGQLTDGASQLADGANKISDGSNKLAAGGNKLTLGLDELSGGTTTLAEKLADADRKLNTVSFKRENSKALANPLTLTHSDKDNVKTNGVGMAPYMMSVSLLVAAMAANIIFYDMLNGDKHHNRFAWAKSKLLINGLISTIASAVLFVTILAMGFDPNHKAATFLMILLTAWSLMAVVTALLGWDRRFGSFASLFFLLFQLGSSAGTYPLEICPPIFTKIGRCLPMSYSVAGLRQSISMTGDIAKPASMLALFIVGAMVVGLLIYRQDKVE